MKTKFKIILKSLGILLGILVIVGLVFEHAFQLHFNYKKPGKDQFCDVDGVNIHFVKKGSGGPTVVFQSGLGGDYKIWQQIQDSLAQHTTTISYDRAGLLWSDAPKGPKNIENITAELTTLLEKTNCPKPYILVGHSLAGITLRPFIRDQQNNISAVVFADVSHPLQIKKSSDELKKYLVVPPKWLIGTFMETGAARVFFAFKPFMADLPVTHWMNRHVRDYFYRSYDTFLQEAMDDDQMFLESEKIQSFGNIPLTIITGAYPKGAGFLGSRKLENEYLSLHRALQTDLLQLSSASKQVIASNSGHYVPLQNPELVIDAVREHLPDLVE